MSSSFHWILLMLCVVFAVLVQKYAQHTCAPTPAVSILSAWWMFEHPNFALMLISLRLRVFTDRKLMDQIIINYMINQKCYSIVWQHNARKILRNVMLKFPGSFCKLQLLYMHSYEHSQIWSTCIDYLIYHGLTLVSETILDGYSDLWLRECVFHAIMCL